MDERELQKEYVMYLREKRLEHLDCEMLFEMIKYFEGLGRNKYDKALERARRILCNVPEGSPIIRDIETIFPELRESEDEKIRKRIHLCLDECVHSDIIRDYERDECFAYLEKQKELFESGRGLYYYDGEKTTYCGYPATEENPYDFAMSQQERHKEPHYTKRNALFDKCVENCDPKIMKRVSDEVDAMLEKEQKPSCGNVNVESEFDKGWRAGHKAGLKDSEQQKPAEWVLPEDFEEAVYKVANFISPFDSQEELRKVSHRFAEQLLSLAKKELDKPAEWSDGDEEIFNNIIEKAKGGHWIEVNEITWLITRFKSLRPSWKPSEEQMSAFKGYIEDFQERAEAAVGGWNNFDVMIRLYEQLKKLM